MTHEHERIHSEAVRWTKEFKAAERNLVEAFIEAEEVKLYLQFEKPSMFQYATEVLGHTESVAYNLITVARKAKVVPAFREAIAQDKISVAKAGRIASHVEKDASLIEFAATHSKREIEIEVAKYGDAKPMNRLKFSGDRAEVTVSISLEALQTLERIQALLAQKNLSASLSDAVEAAAHQYIDRKDPVKKAERNVSELCLGRVGPLSAADKHAVYKRDQGRCTHRDHNGRRCNSDRWVQIHHIVPREQGGSNDPENLTMLCGFHHRQHHRTSA